MHKTKVTKKGFGGDGSDFEKANLIPVQINPTITQVIYSIIMTIDYVRLYTYVLLLKRMNLMHRGRNTKLAKTRTALTRIF